MSHFQIIVFSILLISLILLAAFFSCAETGLMAVNRYRLRHQARLRKRYAIRLLQLLKRPDRVLGVILIGNTFANMLGSSLATLLAFHFWGEHGALLAAMVLTFAVLILAEIAPKTLAAIYPDQVARWVVYPIQLILKLLYPMVWFANVITNGILKLFRIQIGNQLTESLSREELRTVVYDATEKLSRQYQNMLLSILDLNKLTVDDVMLPRHEMTGINVELAWEEMVTQIQNSKQDYLLFYCGEMNEMMGVLYVRDVMMALLAGKVFNKELLLTFLHQPYFVPEKTPLSVQLDYFQKSSDKVAFVVDEYGEIQGVLTLTDILEEIVGDFSSNFSARQQIKEQLDGSYLVNGSITVREFNRITGWELPLEKAKTINGLIVEYLEALPHTGTAVLIGKYPIEIIQVKANQVKTARIFPKLIKKLNAD